MTAAHASTTLARDVDVIHSLSIPLEKTTRNMLSDHRSEIFGRHVWISVHMVFWQTWIYFFTVLDITVHTRPDGDLENLAIEKGNFIDLKIALLHSASHWVLDMDALTCLTS